MTDPVGGLTGAPRPHPILTDRGDLRGCSEVDRPTTRRLRPRISDGLAPMAPKGTNRRTLFIYPSKTSLAGVKANIRALTQGNTNQMLANLLARVNPVLRGWANYFRHVVSSRTFIYLNA